jgi:hypothetical protein
MDSPSVLRTRRLCTISVGEIESMPREGMYDEHGRYVCKEVEQVLGILENHIPLGFECSIVTSCLTLDCIRLVNASYCSIISTHFWTYSVIYQYREVVGGLVMVKLQGWGWPVLNLGRDS